MPSLGSEWIKVRPMESIGGTPFSFKTDISVDKGGMFCFTIPQELEKTARANFDKQTMKGISVGKLIKNYCVWAKSKDEGINFLNKTAHDYIACEVTREQVIVYRTTANLSYYKLHDGTIVPNGGYDKKYPNGGEWGGHGEESYSIMGGPSFTIGIVAAVYTKLTAHRESGDQVTWERAGENCHGVPDNYLDKLNSFIRTGIRSDSLNEMSQIPYTEEAAKFFYDAMLSMCALSDRIESFFGNADDVRLAIANKSGLLLTNGR